MLQGKTKIPLYCVQAAAPCRVQRLFCVICGRATPSASLRSAGEVFACRGMFSFDTKREPEKFEAPQSLRDSSPKGERVRPQALHFSWKLYRYAKGSPFGGAGTPSGVTERVSHPLGEGGYEHSEQTEGVSPTGCIQTDILICCVSRPLIYQLGEIRTFFALLIYQFRLGSYSTEGRESGKRREQQERQNIKICRQNGKCNRNY